MTTLLHVDDQERGGAGIERQEAFIAMALKSVRCRRCGRKDTGPKVPDRDDPASADDAEYGGRIDATPESDHQRLRR